MSELDERRVAELAKRPAQVLEGGGTQTAAREEARKVLETQAAMRPEREQSSDPEEVGG
ncbi:hypothetical protein AB0B12_04595 [Streptomyces sp. NPDC044780]|uniref:hypothetical protein n=1 Tax=unclassified Streptomyces TaxID=2593676 RepID=UPI003406BA66